jgi:G-patch domain
MAADDSDDDYLSDKFLTVAEPQKLKTYTEKRKETLRKSHFKNERNRTKSRRQLELESREEGLSKSLFERAEDDQASGHGPENKALSMMKKMGFRPGQTLGMPTEVGEDAEASSSLQPPLASVLTTHPTSPCRDVDPSQETSIPQPVKQERQLANPLPLSEWSGTFAFFFSPVLFHCVSRLLRGRALPSALLSWSFLTFSFFFFWVRQTSFLYIYIYIIIGRKGIGLGKRAPSPPELERLAKVAKATEEVNQESFRDRTRREFEQRRAEARLVPAQQTCATLDERAGKKVKVLPRKICLLAVQITTPFSR